MVEEPFSEQDLSRIEKRMRRVVQRNLTFEFHEYPRDAAERMNAAEPLKMEIIEEIPEDEKITTYRQGSSRTCARGRMSSRRGGFRRSSC